MEINYTARLVFMGSLIALSSLYFEQKDIPHCLPAPPKKADRIPHQKSITCINKPRQVASWGGGAVG